MYVDPTRNNGKQREFAMNQFVEYRREFHKYAENGWREIRTSARIAEILTGLGYTCLMGPEVVDENAIVHLIRPSDEEKAAEMERAIAQGADPEFVARTKGISGVIAEYDTGRKGPVTAFRFDIDCLPYDEPQTAGFRPFDEGYASVNPARSMPAAMTLIPPWVWGSPPS